MNIRSKVIGTFIKIKKLTLKINSNVIFFKRIFSLYVKKEKVLVDAYNFSSSYFWCFNCDDSRVSGGTLYIYNFLKMKKKFVLGISAYYHDSSVALLEDGNIVYASQEER